MQARVVDSQLARLINKAAYCFQSIHVFTVGF